MRGSRESCKQLARSKLARNGHRTRVCTAEHPGKCCVEYEVILVSGCKQQYWRCVSNRNSSPLKGQISKWYLHVYIYKARRTIGKKKAPRHFQQTQVWWGYSVLSHPYSRCLEANLCFVVRRANRLLKNWLIFVVLKLVAFERLVPFFVERVGNLCKKAINKVAQAVKLSLPRFHDSCRCRPLLNHRKTLRLKWIYYIPQLSENK